MTLQEFFHQHPKAALAFSGGADSAYLLWAGRTRGEEGRPHYGSTPFQPARERADARRLAREPGAPLAGGGLAGGVTTAPDRGECPGSYAYYGTPQRCGPAPGRPGLENVPQAITDSCNVFF